jgi:hypothetical protein
MRPRSLGLAVAVALSAPLAAHAALSVTDTAYTYSQSFDSLATTGTANPWTNDSTLAGWSLFISSLAAPLTYAAGDGSTNTGAFYSFGATGSSNRALGGLASGGAYFGSPASGALAGYIAVAFTNTSGGALTDFTVKFDGEQWRNGGNTSAQTMKLQYGFGTSFSAVTNWVGPSGNFDWSSPVIGATAAAVDGTMAGLVASRGGTISNLSWANNDTLWIRWIELNDVGNDHALAIDNFSLSVASVTSPAPEPGSLALCGLGLALVAGVARRRGGRV